MPYDVLNTEKEWLIFAIFVISLTVSFWAMLFAIGGGAPDEPIWLLLWRPIEQFLTTPLVAATFVAGVVLLGASWLHIRVTGRTPYETLSDRLR